MALSPVLGRQPAPGPYPKPGLPGVSRARPTAASGNRTVYAGLVRPAPRVLLRAALGPGQEPGQERSMCRASRGAGPAWAGMLGSAGITILQPRQEGAWMVGAQGLGRGQGGGAQREVGLGRTHLYPQAVRPWTQQFISLSLSFLIMKMGTTITPMRGFINRGSGSKAEALKEESALPWPSPESCPPKPHAPSPCHPPPPSWRGQDIIPSARGGIQHSWWRTCVCARAHVPVHTHVCAHTHGLARRPWPPPSVSTHVLHTYPNLGGSLLYLCLALESLCV